MFAGTNNTRANSAWITRMATAETAAAARLKGLQKKADNYGIPYTQETTEAILRQSIKDYEATLAPAPKETKAPEVVSAVEVLAPMVDVVKEMKELARTLKGDKATETYGEVAETDVDPEDQLPFPKVYFTPSSWWILPMKRVGGQYVKHPFKRIVFSTEHGRKVQNGTQWNTAYQATFRTMSKREAAYMETHELFGKLFFLSSKEANIMPEQAKRAIRFGKHLAQLNATPAPRVYQQAASLGITLSKEMSLGDIRTKIADELAGQDMIQETQALKNVLTAQGRQELLQQIQHG